MPTVATFYRFVDIADPIALQSTLRSSCLHHGILGTIILAFEGVNATISGEANGVATFIAELTGDPRLAGLEVKYSAAREPPFGKLDVKVKREIVTFGAPEANPARRTGMRVSAQDWNALIDDPDVVLVDTRNAYEVAVGTFPNSIDPETTSFSGFKDFVAAQLEAYRGRTIAMFCTGGIRCEKASAYLIERGFEDVRQLDGGILRYLEDVPSGDSRWQGACYVFDRRVALSVGLEEGSHTMCHACGSPVPTGGTCDCGR